MPPNVTTSGTDLKSRVKTTRKYPKIYNDGRIPTIDEKYIESTCHKGSQNHPLRSSTPVPRCRLHWNLQQQQSWTLTNPRWMVECQSYWTRSTPQGSTSGWGRKLYRSHDRSSSLGDWRCCSWCCCYRPTGIQPRKTFDTVEASAVREWTEARKNATTILNATRYYFNTPHCNGTRYDGFRRRLHSFLSSYGQHLTVGAS